MKILITGASGFIGSHLVEHALARGWEVYAGVRATSNRSALSDPRIKFFIVDSNNTTDLEASLLEFAAETGGFNFVVHNAGVTKPKDLKEFEQGNAIFVREFAETLLRTQPGLRKFIFMSSMAALGPGDRGTLAPITETQRPSPITPYGQSKLKGEELLNEMAELPLITFRPSAVYGPRDYKFLDRVAGMFQQGIEVRLGSPRQRLSFLYVEDLARLTMDACEHSVVHEAFNLSDGSHYSLKEFNQFLKRALQARTFAFRIPTSLLVGYGYLSYATSSLVNKPLHLSHHKMRELTAHNWIVDISKAREMLGYAPEYMLEAGVQRTIESMQ